MAHWVQWQLLQQSLWACAGFSIAVLNACIHCNCVLKMTKKEEGLLITNSNVSYCELQCVQRF